ncbi:MAG: hypothetical protein A3F72_09820 [Bacteroidetes bacterium RIFCSPLOWO2_12_FULL_35_15]|nr:MAG: hypothetical protein A3F72_09820 [Bacteroidetes bacterium RIFCSPLOWO2_12_FULL_35_15]
MNNRTTKFVENQKLVIPTKGGFLFIYPSDIIRCEANKKYATCILKNNIQEELSISLKQVEAVLKECGFIRVHHAHLININHVEKYETVKYCHRGGAITMSSGEVVNISIRKKKFFKKYFLKNSIEAQLSSNQSE